MKRVSVSHERCNKSAPTRYLNRNTASHSGGWKSEIRVSASVGSAPSEGSRGESFLALYSGWWLPAVLAALWLIDMLSSLCPFCHVAFFPMSLDLNLSLLRRPPVIGVEPTPTQYDLLCLDYICTTLFPNKVTFIGIRDFDWPYNFF